MVLEIFRGSIYSRQISRLKHGKKENEAAQAE
jgi:hypothetical protein